MMNNKQITIHLEYVTDGMYNNNAIIPEKKKT